MANKPTQPLFPLGIETAEQSKLKGFLNTDIIEHGPDAIMTVPETKAADGLPSAVRYNSESDDFEGFYEHGGWLPLGGGGVRWEVLPHAPTATLESGRGYLINNTSGASTVVLPLPTRIGDSVTVCDMYGKFSVYPLTIDPNGNAMYGNVEAMTISTDSATATFTWTGDARGWIITAGVGLGQGRVYSRTIYTDTLGFPTSEVTLTTQPTIVDVYVDGKRLVESKYSLSGYEVRFSPSLPAGVELQVVQYVPIQLGLGSGGSDSGITPWVYNGGAAVGGETTISVPDLALGVPFITINGYANYPRFAYSYDAGAHVLTFGTPLEVGDMVVLMLSGEVAGNIPVNTSAGFLAIEALRRTYAEAGYNLVEGSFGRGGTVDTATDVLLNEVDGKAYSWGGTHPKTVTANSTPDNSGGVGSDAWLSVGDAALRVWTNKNVTINFKTVGDLVSGTLPSGEVMHFLEGMEVETAANEYGIVRKSTWLISSTKSTNTYSIALTGGMFANLVLRQSMGYEEFGFGSMSPITNSASVDEANRVARANSVMRKLSFPSGSFSVNQVNLDVDRRGFTFSGAGNDATILMSADSDISLHHVGIDPRDRNRDRLHWHQTIEGFTVNGGVEEKGASAAGRAIYTAPYATIKNKSINHRISNYDLLHLVLYWYGRSQGKSNGATSTKYGVRVRNNSIKLMGYIGGSTGQCTVSIEGMSTTLSSAANIGDTTVTVVDAAGFDTWFEIAFTNSTGGVETRRITAISGNVLTLDRAMTSAFQSGTKVEVPIIGTSVISSTIETGEIRIGDSQATYIAGNYSEEAKMYITKYVRALTVIGTSTAEASPAITIEVDRRSSIKIEGNDTTFSISVNITDRSGSVGERIDLYNAPKLDISMNTRIQNPIILNGVYGLSSLKIDKTFDTVVQDNRFTQMTFSGFNHVTPAGGPVLEVMKFYQNSAQYGFDGYTFDLDITCRRDGASASVTPGLMKRYGTSSAAPAAQNSAPVSLFSDFNATTGYDVFIGASGNRGTVQIRPNPSSAIKSTISGVVTSVI